MCMWDDYFFGHRPWYAHHLSVICFPHDGIFGLSYETSVDEHGQLMWKQAIKNWLNLDRRFKCKPIMKCWFLDAIISLCFRLSIFNTWYGVALIVGILIGFPEIKPVFIIRAFINPSVLHLLHHENWTYRYIRLCSSCQFPLFLTLPQSLRP